MLQDLDFEDEMVVNKGFSHCVDKKEFIRIIY